MSQKKTYPTHASGSSIPKSQSFARVAALAILPVVTGISLLPSLAGASLLGDLVGIPVHADATKGTGNLQTMPLLKPAMNINPVPATGGGDVTIIDDSALVPEEGPSGTIADIEKPKNSTVSVYVVRSGDSLSSIAKLFDVSPNTILWANNLSRDAKLQVGQSLVILPVTGVKYTVKKGDTLAKIAKRFGGDAADIGSFNGVDDATLGVGVEIIIPDGEVAAASAQTGSSNANKPGGTAKKPRRGLTGPSSIFANNPKEPAHDVGAIGTVVEVGYYTAPVAHYTRTQGIHGYNAVDMAAPVGTPIVAAAEGDVTVARAGGWNGGYGSYVVISHDNGSQTLYGHMSRVLVYDGQHVERGQVIGYVGSTGSSTGPHVHFEIRNGIRNPF